MKSDMSDRDGTIWFDGKHLPWRDAKIHVLTHGLHYASAVFEGVRAYGGHCFKLVEHMERLIYSANRLDMKVPFSVDALCKATEDLLVANKLTDSYIRPFVWRGSEKIAAAAPDNSIHVAIAAWAMPNYFDAAAKAKGIRVQVGDWRRPPASCGPVHAKCSANYTITTLAKHRALADGFDDALLLDVDGNIAEVTAANVFFVRGRELHTPVPDCFLNGITRQTVIELAAKLSLQVVERKISLNDLDSFTECFVTGTASEVTPVAMIGDKSFPGREVSGLVDKAYTDLVLRRS